MPLPVPYLTKVRVGTLGVSNPPPEINGGGFRVAAAAGAVEDASASAPAAGSAVIK
jgi:hypothetical protein